MQATVLAEEMFQSHWENDFSLVNGVGCHRGNFDRSLPQEAHALRMKVRRQLDEIGRLCRLKRYLSPQITETILNEESALFGTHRRDITVVFLDLRGFTAFSDAAEPEEVLHLLKEYHGDMGRLILDFNGTVEHLAGDGLMVFFNDPVPQEDHTERAMRMAIEMRERAKALRADWLKQGRELDLGIGLAAGSAALGNIGSAGKLAYTAVGNVTNLASRLCGIAKGGQILTDHRTAEKVGCHIEVEPVGALHLKGFSRPVNSFNVLRWTDA
jgi:adenylate cyclase